MRLVRRWIAMLCLFALLPLCAPAEQAIGIVTASALVLRAGPGIAYDILGELPNGTELLILEEESGWYHVEYGTKRGYVYSDYVRISQKSGYTATQDMITTYTIAEEGGYTISALETASPNAQATIPPSLQRPDLLFDEENNPNYPRVLMAGDMGNSVLDLQITLQQMGYQVSTDGQFDYATEGAVMKLQNTLELDMDGIVGNQTRRLIGGDGTPGEVELLDWWIGGSVSIVRLSEATIVDVRTGKRFRVSRYGGDSHCDAEPLTKADTAAFLSIAGGEWSWDRRPVWVEVNGRVLCGSMNAMPQDGQYILDNDFNGHFCIHLLNSRTNDTDRVDEQHAACVQEAWEKRDQYTKKQ